jgi:hypothetical protein
MKKYSWIVALLLALSLAFFACDNGSKGDDDDDDDDGVVVKADPIDVAFAQDMLDVWGGGDIVAEADGSGFTFTYGTGDNASHGNAVAMFKVDLGEAKVRDYEKVTFTFEGISGDIGENTGQYDRGVAKGVNLLAAADKDNLKNFGGNDDGLVTYIVNAYSGAASGATINAAGAKIGEQPKAIDLELAIAPSRPQASNKGEVWFSIYLHASAKKWDSGTAAATPEEKTSFKITNVTFVPRAAALGDVAVDVAAIAGITVPATGGTPVAAITETTQFTGAVTWAGALDSAGKFAQGTVYTATITLTAKEGFTFTGVAADFFTVAGATATNPANSGVVTAVFPAAQNPPTEVVLFDLATWIASKTEGVLTDGDLSPSLARAGAPVITKTGNTLVVSNRAQDWHAFDIVTSGFTFDYDTYDYTLTLSGSSDTAGDNLKAGRASGPPYDEIDRVSATEADTVYTLTKPVPEKASDDSAAFGNIRIQTTTATADYTITVLKLVGVEK